MFAGSNTRTAASANRAPPRAHTSDESGMVDRRRWTSFLTWAFVLSEMAGRDGLLPTAAHAGEDDLGRVSHAGLRYGAHRQQSSQHQRLDGDRGAGAHHLSARADACRPTRRRSYRASLARPRSPPVTTMQGMVRPWRRRWRCRLQADASRERRPTDAGVHLSLGDAPFLAFAQDGRRSISASTSIPSGLLGGVADGLGGLPLVGGLLEDVGSTLASTTGNLLSLVGLGGDSGAHSYGNDVGTPGQLAFGDSAAAARPHELATPSGGYTTYGIALNLGSVRCLAGFRRGGSARRRPRRERTGQSGRPPAGQSPRYVVRRLASRSVSAEDGLRHTGITDGTTRGRVADFRRA